MRLHNLSMWNNGTGNAYNLIQVKFKNLELVRNSFAVMFERERIQISCVLNN